MNDSILDTQEQDDPNKDYFNELVGEGKKYKDPQALAKAYHHADTHLKVVTKTADELRTDYLREREENQARAKLEELIKQLEQKQLASSEQPSGERSQEKPTVDLTEIDKRFDNRLQQYEVSKREQQNVSLVKSKLQERFGDNYQPLVKQQIDELGLSTDDFDALAKKSPTALFKTLGLDNTQRESFQAPPRSANAFTPKGSVKKTWSYYKSLKKDKPDLFKDPRITNEMTQSAAELGDAFYDGDF